MSNQLQITGGAKVRNLEGVITGATGILGSVPYGGPNGVATLDSAGKVPVSQLPNSVMEFKGTWNAATNTPTLANGTGNAGDVYLCNVAGTVNFGAGPIAFAVGDYVVYSGSTWERSSGATGTVTSVAASITGNSIGLTGSPITTAGTLAFAFAGTSGQYINGAGNLVTFPTLTGYVPYTGATSDVDLGAFKLNAQSLHAKGTAGAGHLGLKHQSASATATANESSLFADVNGDMAWKNDSLYLLTLNSHLNTADRTYTFPDASGTIALTSDIPSLAGYVPYTGATTNVNLGAYQLTATNLIANGSTGTSGMLHLKNDASQVPKGNGYTSIGASSTSILVQTYTGVSTYKSYLLNASLLTDGVNRIYTLPDASGTIALVGGSGVGTVTSVALSAPTGFSVTGSPITTSGTLALAFASGYSLPTTASQTNWDTAYTNRITSLTTTGSSGAATLTSNVLNIPNYGLALSGYLPLTGGTLTGPLVGTIATFVASTGNRALTLTGAANAYLIDGTASTATGQSYGPIFRAGTNSSDSSLIVTDANASTTYFVIKGDGEARFKYSLTLGNVIGTGTGAFYAGAGTFNGNVTLGNTTTYSTLSITQQNNVDALLITDGYNSNFKIQSYFNATLGNLIYSNDFTNTGYVPLTAYTSKFSLPVGSLVVGGSNDNGYAFYINGNTKSTGSIEATSFVKTSGTSSQYLMADGSVSTLSNPVTGTGTTNYVPKFTGTGTIGNSTIQDDGTNVSISGGLTASSFFRIFKNGSDSLGSGPFFALYNAGASAAIFQQLNASNGLDWWTTYGRLMTLTANGRLLIGTSTEATYLLDVNGTGRFSGNLYAAQIGVGYNTLPTWTGAKAIQAGLAGSFYGDGLVYGWQTGMVANAYRTGGTTWAYQTSGVVATRVEMSEINPFSIFTAVSGTAGNTITWTNPLTIASTGAATFSSTVQVPSGASGGLYKMAYGGSTSSRSWQIASDAYNYGDFGIQVSNSQTGTTYTNALLISNAGNVGIGTTSPSSKLSVLKSESGSSPTPGLRIENTGAAYQSRMVLTDGNTNDGIIAFQGGYTSATQYLGFGIGSSPTQMVLTAAGNVGIGTTSPAAILDINTAGSSIRFGDKTTYTNDINVYYRTGGLLRQDIASGGSFTWGLSGGSEFMRIKSTGIINLSNVPTSTSGLVTGDIYKTVAGVLMIVL